MQQTHKEVEAEMKQMLGNEFGTDFHYVLNDYIFTKLAWRFYRSFYDSNKERRDLLRSVSDPFFGVVAVCLFEKVILGLCRLLDPAETQT